MGLDTARKHNFLSGNTQAHKFPPYSPHLDPSELHVNTFLFGKHIRSKEEVLAAIDRYFVDRSEFSFRDNSIHYRKFRKSARE